MGSSLLVTLLLAAALDPRVCVEETPPPEIVARLAAYLRTLEVHTECRAGIARIRLTRTTLTLERPDGTARRRALPWRLDEEAPVRSAARLGRLSELAVMIEALALEPVAGLLPPPAPAPHPTKRRPRRPPTPPPAVEPSEPQTPPPEPWPPIVPSATGISSAVRARVADRSRYAVGVQSWLRYRTPGVTTLEFAVQVERNGWFVRGGGAPTASWALDGRPVQLTSFGATGGFSGRLGVGRSVDLTWSAGLTVESLLVTRADVEAAATHATVDAGAAVGIGAALQPFDGVSLTLFAEGLVFPTARDVVVPDGPSARLNRWGARAGVEIAWVFFGAHQIEKTTGVEDQNRRRETSAR